MSKKINLEVRNKKQKLVSNKKRKLSSQLWLQRQLNDIYVQAAKKDGYISRAAYKLIEINDKFKILNSKSVIIDLGAAPGGWSQVACKILSKNIQTSNNYQIIAVDLLEMNPLDNVHFIQGDFTDISTVNTVLSLLKEQKADLVMSDMSPNTTGSQSLDHLRIMNLVEETFLFSQSVLKEGGNMIVKVFQGGTESKLLEKIKKNFKKVRHFKPNSSRKESSEVYLVALDFHST